MHHPAPRRAGVCIPWGFAGVGRAGAHSVFGMFSAEFGFLQRLCLCCLEISAVTPIKITEAFSKKKYFMLQPHQAALKSLFCPKHKLFIPIIFLNGCFILPSA